CPVTTCLATDDPYLLDSVDQYDAVMFHWPSLCDYPYVASRSEHQLFVMVSDESPQHSRIDIFGKCGKPFCSFDQLNDCYQRIEIDYKFYLSFENSLCRDYITEKFFNLLDRNIVPIVYGAGNYEAIAPPHSYIDALKYTPVQLAKYLDILDKNDTLYNEYFWWKPFYKLMANIAFCQLCQQLNQPRTHVQWYHDIDAWYDGGNHCHKPNRFKVPYTFSYFIIIGRM
ncbi:hypothetical protein DAPPUDRAFT_61832, partial [Daphnia pulex]